MAVYRAAGRPEGQMSDLVQHLEPAVLDKKKRCYILAVFFIKAAENIDISAVRRYKVRYTPKSTSETSGPLLEQCFGWGCLL